MTFAAWLTQQRKRRMLTQAQAAARCGVSLKAWQAWEQDVRRPTPRHFGSIIRGLGCDPCDPIWRRV